MGKFNLRKLNDMEVKEWYQVKILNRITTLENLNGNMDINRTWESITNNIKASFTEHLRYYEMKQHKT
jgi:hypothetical protein